MKTLAALVLFTGLLAPGFAQSSAPATAAEKIANNAANDLESLLTASDRGVPRRLLDDSACVIVVPNLIKGGFIVGGEYGRGLFSCRHSSGVGWTAPGFVRIMGGKFGLLIGGASADIVMLVMNKNGMEHLIGSRFQLGGEASAAAGPIGRNASALTDAAMHAEILTYSQQRGIFGGIDLSGSAVVQDTDLNSQAYGRKITNREIVTGDVKTPASLGAFTRTLSHFSSRK